MNIHLFYLTPLFLLIPLTVFADTCPNHSEIKASSNFSGISYDERHATLQFSVDHSHQTLSLTFKLPASPPFARTSMPFYNQDYTYGSINWGFTERYQHDFSKELIKFTSFQRAYEHGAFIDCVYVSLLENNMIYGHIWIDSR
ncbi:MAG: hypothetical protein VX737_05390 [Pseudomonadota bacterium]|nr:hypothetical protein [Pseudomonadota bacterium]